VLASHANAKSPLAIEASSADEALRILESRSDVGVLFTDVEMPPATLTKVRLAEIVR
jgi:two-component system, response regulator PdtaR